MVVHDDTAATNLATYSVSELSGQVKRTVEDAFGYVRVRGELGRVSRSGNGHCYLDLKDDRAVLSSVVWKGSWGRLKLKPEQGMEVIATGRMTTFAGQSRYQLVIDQMELAGEGALMALLERRRRELAEEGLFALERKRPLPALPEIIGVVTSPSGAVIRDILHRLRDRFPVHVIVWPTPVQGEGAGDRIASAVERFNRLSPDGPVPRPDLLIVARGGGSLEDLWCFNDEAVVRAVAASEIPVISAVGHETDTTLIDYAADMRAPTPTAAAELAVPVRNDLLRELNIRQGRLSAAIDRKAEALSAGLLSAARGLGRPDGLIAPAEQRFDQAGMRLAGAMRDRQGRAETSFARTAPRLSGQLMQQRLRGADQTLTGLSGRLRTAPGRLVERATERLTRRRLPLAGFRYRTGEAGDRLEAMAARLGRADRRALKDRQDKLAAAERLLGSLSYRGTLARGYAIVMDEDGRPIPAAAGAAAGQSVTLRFADGDRGAIIAPEGIGSVPPAPKPRKPKKAAAKPSGPPESDPAPGAQPTLFEE